MYDKFIVILESYISRYVFNIAESFVAFNIILMNDSIFSINIYRHMMIHYNLLSLFARYDSFCVIMLMNHNDL